MPVIRAFARLTLGFLHQAVSCSHPGLRLAAICRNRRRAVRLPGSPALSQGRRDIHSGRCVRPLLLLAGSSRPRVHQPGVRQRSSSRRADRTRSESARRFSPERGDDFKLDEYGRWPVANGLCPGAGETTRFVFVGDVVRDKGVVELVTAFDRAHARLEGSGVRIEMSVFGLKARDDALETVAPLLKAHSERISIQGPIAHTRLITELSRRDVLVLPTKWRSEGHPGVIIEAMSLGLPVIATRFRAIPEIVKDGANGLLCTPGDVESLADCIVRMATDPVRRAEMGRAALRSARRFDIRRVAPELCRACGIPIEATCPA